VRDYFYDNPPPGTRVAAIKAESRQVGRSGVSSMTVAAGGVSP
jgi:hypothetical protein